MADEEMPSYIWLSPRRLIDEPEALDGPTAFLDVDDVDFGYFNNLDGTGWHRIRLTKRTPDFKGPIRIAHCQLEGYPGTRNWYHFSCDIQGDFEDVIKLLKDARLVDADYEPDEATRKAIKEHNETPSTRSETGSSDSGGS